MTKIEKLEKLKVKIDGKINSEIEKENAKAAKESNKEAKKAQKEANKVAAKKAKLIKKGKLKAEPKKPSSF